MTTTDPCLAQLFKEEDVQPEPLGKHSSRQNSTRSSYKLQCHDRLEKKMPVHTDTYGQLAAELPGN